MKQFHKHFTWALAGLASLLGSPAAQAQPTIQDYSATKTKLVKLSTDFTGLKIFNIISSEDVSGSYRFGGSADGSGLIKNEDGTFTLLINHEDNFGVSRIILDKDLKPIKREWIMNSNAGMWRLCSATMATPEEHGFGPLYLTCGESGVESMTHGINPYSAALTDTSNTRPTVLYGLGHWSAENAVPLNKKAYPGKTIILIGDDDSGPHGGQLAMYLGEQGDLKNGKLYVLRRPNMDQKENSMVPGNTYDVEFVEIPDHKTKTGAQLNSYSNSTLKSVKFGRVEDIDYRKGSAERNREIYYTVTGQDVSGDNADSSRTKWGRVYRLIMDPANPLKGTLEVILNGDDKSTNNPGRMLYDPDNIVVTQDYVYVQEDPNGYGKSWDKPHIHDGRIYQYDIETKGFKTVMELDHRRSAPDSLKWNSNGSGTYARSGIGGWEYGALIDVSQTTGGNDLFLLALQPHSWQSQDFKGIDGGTIRTSEQQGSMLVAVEGLPRVKSNNVAPVAGNISICPGNTATLQTSGGLDGVKYNWYDGPTGGTKIHTGSKYTTPALNAAKSYYVSAEIGGIESGRTKVEVNMNAAPVADLGPDVTVCGSGTLNANNIGAKFLWNDGSNGQTLNVTKSGKYWVTVSTSSGCWASDTIKVTVTAKPATPNISVRGNKLYSSAIQGNQWYRNGSLIPGATGQQYDAKEPGEYAVRIMNTGSCVSEMSPSVTVFEITGIAEELKAQGLTFYPNPNAGRFTLNFDGKGKAKNMSLEIVSLNGKTIFSDNMTNAGGVNYSREIDITHAPAGIYILRLTTEDMVLQTKIEKN